MCVHVINNKINQYPSKKVNKHCFIEKVSYDYDLLLPAVASH